MYRLKLKDRTIRFLKISLYLKHGIPSERYTTQAGLRFLYVLALVTARMAKLVNVAVSEAVGVILESSSLSSGTD